MLPRGPPGGWGNYHPSDPRPPLLFSDPGHGKSGSFCHHLCCCLSLSFRLLTGWGRVAIPPSLSLSLCHPLSDQVSSGPTPQILFPIYSTIPFSDTVPVHSSIFACVSSSLGLVFSPPFLAYPYWTTPTIAANLEVVFVCLRQAQRLLSSDTVFGTPS